MFSIGGSEILVLGILALLLFGNKNLPENMKKMVKGLNEVKKVAHDAQRSWHDIRDDVTRQIMADDAATKAREELAEVRRALSAPVQGQAPLERDDGASLIAQAEEGSQRGLQPLAEETLVAAARAGHEPEPETATPGMDVGPGAEGSEGRRPGSEGLS